MAESIIDKIRKKVMPVSTVLDTAAKQGGATATVDMTKPKSSAPNTDLQDSIKKQMEQQKKNPQTPSKKSDMGNSKLTNPYC